MIASAKRARSQITTLGATRYGIKQARGATPLTYCDLLRGPSSLKMMLDVPVPCPGFPMKPALKIEPNVESRSSVASASLFQKSQPNCGNKRCSVGLFDQFSTCFV